jgi:hypothetical protein
MANWVDGLPWPDLKQPMAQAMLKFRDIADEKASVSAEVNASTRTAMSVILSKIGT